jgi:hypothetical protein
VDTLKVMLNLCHVVVNDYRFRMKFNYRGNVALGQDGEPSGLLNLAVSGLRRLLEHGRFSCNRIASSVESLEVLRRLCSEQFPWEVVAPSPYQSSKEPYK